jgi:DNA-binding transcriptional LysR family regulator
MLSIEYRYFYQSALDSSFRKAADNLNINSSAVVRQIHKLENNLQLKLFNRSSKGLELTSHGHMLFKYVTEHVERNELFLENIQHQETDLESIITISTVFLSGIVKEFQDKYKNVRFNIIAKKPDSIIEDLILNKCEIGITFTKDVPKSLNIIFEKNFPVGILCSPEHFLAQNEFINVNKCLEYPLVFHPGTLILWKKLQRELGFKAFMPKPKMIANSYALIKSYLVKNKNSLFFSTKLGALDELQKGSLVYKKVKNKTLLNNNIGILVSKNKIIKQITEKFLETLTNNFKKF